MALQSCRECGREVSTEAATCPHCGVPQPSAVSRSRVSTPEVPQQQVTTRPSSGAKRIALRGLGWIGGVILGLAGLGALSSSPVEAAMLIVASAILLPPVNDWISSRLRVVLSAWVKALAVSALIVGAVLSASLSSAANVRRAAADARQAEERKAGLRSDFEQNRTTVLRQIDSAVASRDYAHARAIADRYTGAVTDTGYLRRFNAILAGQKREHDLANERRLLAQAAATPSANLEQKRDVYRQLMAVNPSNTTYKAQFNDYSNRIRQQQAAEQDRIRRFGPAPEASAWDGTYREVKDYLGGVMNDPSSLEGLECTKVYYGGPWLARRLQLSRSECLWWHDQAGQLVHHSESPSDRHVAVDGVQSLTVPACAVRMSGLRHTR